MFGFCAHMFTYRQFPESDTVFGDFDDDNVCACTVGSSILLSLVNLLPEMDLATVISRMTRNFLAVRCCFSHILVAIFLPRPHFCFRLKI